MKLRINKFIDFEIVLLPNNIFGFKYFVYIILLILIR